MAIQAAARRHPDPAFADAIFLDVGLLLPLEADADAALQQVGVEIRTARIERQAIGRRIGHAARSSAFAGAVQLHAPLRASRDPSPAPARTARQDGRRAPARALSSLAL